MRKNSFLGGRLEGLFLRKSFWFGFLGFLLINPVWAIEHQGFSVRPAYPNPEIENSKAWFIYNLEPGQATQDGLEIINSSNESKQVLVYAADSVKSSSGGFALKQLSQEKKEVGSWIRFYSKELKERDKALFKEFNSDIVTFCEQAEKDNLIDWCSGQEKLELTLKPKESIIIPFVFNIPTEIETGEYTGGILAQEVESREYNNKVGSSVSLTKRLGVRVYQTVPGEVVRELQISNFDIEKKYKEVNLKNILGLKKDDKKMLIKMKVENLGNVSIQHKSIITIKNLLNGEVSEVNRSFQVLKEDSFVSSYDWQVPWGGVYSFSGEISYQDEKGVERVVKTNAFIKRIIPWKYLFWFSFGSVFFLGLFFWFWIKNKKLYSGEGWVFYQVKEGDTLNLLTRQHGIDWKILVKTNKIKPPYEIIPGMKLLVPPAQTVKKEEDSRKNLFLLIKKVRLGRIEKVKHGEVIEQVGNFKRVVRRIGIQKNRAKEIISLSLIIFIFGWMSGVAINNWFDKKQLKNVASISLQSPTQKDDRLIGSYRAEKFEKEKNETLKKEDFDNFEIQVLNGAGVPGLAGSFSKLLKDLGYNQVKTDNADNYDYNGIKILYKQHYQAQADNLRSLLEQQGYKQVELNEQADLSGDLVLIVGRDG